MAPFWVVLRILQTAPTTTSASLWLSATPVLKRKMRQVVSGRLLRQKTPRNLAQRAIILPKNSTRNLVYPWALSTRRGAERLLRAGFRKTISKQCPNTARLQKTLRQVRPSSKKGTAGLPKNSRCRHSPVPTLATVTLQNPILMTANGTR